MSKKYVINRALSQFILDFNGDLSNFINEGIFINPSSFKEGRRTYIEGKPKFKAIAIGNSGIVMADSIMVEVLRKKLSHIKAPLFFNYENLKLIDSIICEYGQCITDVHNYYLPLPCELNTEPLYDIRWVEQEEINSDISLKRFTNAFAYIPTAPDVIGVLAMDNGEIIGAAGASKDSADMWQIGIDVDKKYGGRGIGVNLVKLIKEEILRRGKLPYYGMVTSNTFSKNTAINSGFFPVWSEIYSKEI